MRENATGSKTAAASPTESSKKDAVPELVEKKAEEAQQPAQSAYNEETGEINWDCPVRRCRLPPTLLPPCQLVLAFRPALDLLARPSRR